MHGDSCKFNHPSNCFITDGKVTGNISPLSIYIVSDERDSSNNTLPEKSATSNFYFANKNIKQRIIHRNNGKNASN